MAQRQTVAFCVLGRGTGDEMGRNEVSVFVCNESRWGDMGRNRLSPLEMGIKGGGRVSIDPQAKEVERQVDRKLNLNMEIWSKEKKQDRKDEGGCATRVWFEQITVLMSTGVVVGEGACAPRHT
jgi:hypothetical protein